MEQASEELAGGVRQLADTFASLAEGRREELQAQFSEEKRTELLEGWASLQSAYEAFVAEAQIV